MAGDAEGRGWPLLSRKAHYFVGTRSLCGKWGFYAGRLEEGSDGSPDDCAECSRRLAKRRAKETRDSTQE